MGPLARLQQASFRLLCYGRAVAAADRSLLARRVLLLASDGVVLALSFWAAFALRLNAISPQALSDSLVLQCFWLLAWERCWPVAGTAA